MEVYRANLTLLEDQQLAAAAGQPAAQPQLQAAAAAVSAASLGFSSAMTTPRLLLSDSTAYHQLGTEIPGHMAAPAQAANLASPNPMYAIAAQSNITNNNTLQYPGNIQQQTLLKPYNTAANPQSISVHAPGTPVTPGAPANDMTQPSYVYHPLCATPLQQPRPITAATPAPAPTPLMIPNKLKATPTLISLQSARDHKFMPY